MSLGGRESWRNKFDREQALKREHEARQEVYQQAARREGDSLQFGELVTGHGTIEYQQPSPGIGIGLPEHCSRLVMLPGVEFYFEFPTPPPNWWRRFWTWALLGWMWTKVEKE